MALICDSMNLVIKQSAKKLYYLQIRQSQWSPAYKTPILDKNQFEELEKSGQLKELAFKPIKAAFSHEVCSLFFDRTLNKFISKGLVKGQKALMRELMRETFAIIKRTQIIKYNNALNGQKADIECNPLTILHKAVDNCRPLIITRPIKRGGATYQVPYPLSSKDSEALAMKWLIHAVRDRPKPRKIFFPEAMAKELIDAYYNEGKVVKKKQDMHRQCEANKAYAHYRWG
jgi:small subunit ribosomal protein S7